jgi:pimeloyl-ACP methyl ester carboxylesterase
MLFGGVQRAAKVLDLVKLDRPVIWATFDYPYEPPRKFRFPSSLQYVPEAKAAIHGTFDGVVKLHEALRARADVDPRRITVIGASAGAPFATVGAARTDIPGVILVQGFADVVRVWQNLMTRKRRAKYGDWIDWPALWLARLIHWYCEIPDIAAHARRLRASQKVLVFNTIGDDYIPAEASEPLWRALEESPAQYERIMLTGKHLGVGDDSQLIADILQRSLSWLEQQALL